MSLSMAEEWTTEDVHHWLVTDVKVPQSCADKFLEEEVLGEYLLSFKKKDIVDLGIKQGPAVKITCYLKNLKEGSKHQSKLPAFVEKWTKEQVSQWLQQHGKIYGKYVALLQQEDVSGDCLVCFQKQDFLDLGVKSGPAVKICAELEKLNSQPEPTLQGAPCNSTEQKDSEQSARPDPNPPQTSTIKPPDPQSKTEPKSYSENALLLMKAPVRPQNEREEHRTESPAAGATRTENNLTKQQPDLHQIAVKIQDNLDGLAKEDLKKFCFMLSEHTKSKPNPIPLGQLKDKDTIDITKLMTDYYGREQALQMTIDVLKESNQWELACQLERTTGRMKPSYPLKEAVKKEANQGYKLKTLLTCGGNSLDSYDRFVVVVNKSSPEQVQYLHFLSKLNLFCVLDFDPNSNASGGLCYSYRDWRGANLHVPSQFQGQTESVIKNLNLYKQTSWVFCNGRCDLDSDSNKELDYQSWLRKSCKDVDHLISFICNPDILLHRRYLIIFLLLSPVENDKDPVFDTYKSFIKQTDEKDIVTICESPRTFLKWKELILQKCDFDIEQRSISELTLSEINGTIMALVPFNQSSDRLLPSSGSSAVVLKQKDEDLLTALEVLCLNECENMYDEDSSEFHEFRISVEEEFYRGGKVKWWNFYFCEKEKSFIKREKYKNVKDMIQSQWRDSTNCCVLLNLFHHPGCGGTTLAMHVMWDLRRDFRCALLKDDTLPKTEVASQVMKLMKLGTETLSPVLLLVDDSKGTENSNDLVKCIRQTVESINVDSTQNYKVIILNCVRSHSPQEQYRELNSTQNQFITAALIPVEQREFDKKLKDLKDTHKAPENFYSFMIMKSNFDQKYIDKLAHNTLDKFDFSTKEAQLFAFLALLNTYVAKSEMALSLCEDFFEMKVIPWKVECVLDRMKLFSNLLIIVRVEDMGGYKGIRILHHTIASACLEELERSYGLKVSEIVMNLLHYDLFFSVNVVKLRLMLSIQRMLIERQRKKDGDEREPFSPLTNKIHSQQGRQAIQEIFVKASSRYVTSVSIPQALARYLYIYVRDFSEALKWAEKAKDIKQNPYTFDTIGQVYKSHLRSNMDREKQEMLHNPEDLHTNLTIANDAMKAFRRAQESADCQQEVQAESFDDDSEDYPRKSYNVYGYVRMLEIAFMVFDILSTLPLFEEHDPMKKHSLQSFLEKKIRISIVYKEDNDVNKRYAAILQDHEQFLGKLKSEVKKIFDLLNCYFVYIKGTCEFDKMNHRLVCQHFKKYVQLFCNTPQEKKSEQENNPHLKLKIEIEDRKLFLETTQADTFSGILQHLDRPPKEMEKITECYAFLLRESDNQQQRTKMTINYILSNIVLHHSCSKKSKRVKSYEELSALLLDTLQSVGLSYSFPDPYYLALLLFWPSPTEENTEICKYVTAIRRSSHRHLSKLFRRRSTIAKFYLAKENGLERLITKPKLDQSFPSKMKGRWHTLAQLWQNGDIFKENAIIRQLHRVSGTIEEGEVYANYGKVKIPVRPALLSGIRSGFSTEKVSFYLGFAINGPLAYDIKYDN